MVVVVVEVVKVVIEVDINRVIVIFHIGWPSEIAQLHITEQAS